VKLKGSVLNKPLEDIRLKMMKPSFFGKLIITKGRSRGMVIVCLNIPIRTPPRKPYRGPTITEAALSRGNYW
jgi:hypothetical protein